MKNNQYFNFYKYKPDSFTNIIYQTNKITLFLFHIKNSACAVKVCYKSPFGSVVLKTFFAMGKIGPTITFFRVTVEEKIVGGVVLLALRNNEEKDLNLSHCNENLQKPQPGCALPLLKINNLR
jgi:hypothetical protein